MRTHSAAYVSTASVSTRMWYCSATCATWQCTKNATACRTYPRANGCVVAAYNRHRRPFSAYCVRITRRARTSRPIAASGCMSCAPSGYPRCISPTPYSSSPSSASSTSIALAGSSCVLFVVDAAWARAFNATSKTATRRFMSHALNKLDSTWTSKKSIRRRLTHQAPGQAAQHMRTRLQCL